MDDSKKTMPTCPSGAEDDIDFTGERVVPGKVDPDLFNEHFARYVYARNFCSGKTVLDTGCGTGYGAQYIAERANYVVGIDFDGQATRYALANHSCANTRYLVGDCQQLPFASQSFEAITSFELIEHLPDAKAYLQEVKRVLKAAGTFLVSTPNRPVYHEHLGVVNNPFHVREWDYQEFVAFLREFFGSVEVLGETHVSAVSIAGQRAGVTSAVTDGAGAVESADYFVCVCSNQPQNAGSMVFVPQGGNVLLERERHNRILARDLKERETYLSRLQPQFEQMAAWATKLNAELADTQAQAHQLRSKVQELSVLFARETRLKRAFVFASISPLEWVIGSMLVATELAGRFRRFLGRKFADLTAVGDVTSCSVIIVSWEGKDLLAESLPALLQALRIHGGRHEVIVVDNGSTDGTEEYLHAQFPEVRVVRSEHNEYFGGGNNLGVAAATNDIILLLNNDMIVQEDFLTPLLKPFTEGDVFAVASQVFLADRRRPREETGKTSASFNGSDFDWKHCSITQNDEQQQYVPVFWGHGGAVALDRRKFLFLGGFDRTYDPFYVEDADLSYQAWKTGWRCLLAVQSKVIHKHRSSTSRFGNQFISQIVRRNHELFIWKNVSDLSMLFQRFLSAPRKRMQRAGIPDVGIRAEVRALLGALRRLPNVLRSRLRLAPWVRRTDQEILEITNCEHNNISSHEVDFSTAGVEQQLGAGWYAPEESGGQTYRWMGKQATLYLRAPSENCDLLLAGYVPALSHYRTPSLTLTVRCDEQLLQFPLSEGPFERRYKLQSLRLGTAVLVQLAVDHAIPPQALDTRTLGVIWNRIALDPQVEAPAESDDEQTPKQVQVVPAPVRPDENGEVTTSRRVLMICAYLPCLGVHSGGNTMFNLIRTLSKRHRLTLLSFYERESEREQFVPELMPYCERLELVYRNQSFDTPNLFGLKPPEIVYDFYHKRMQRLVREYILTSSFDLIQCEFLQTGHFAYADPSVPAVLTNHETLSLSYANRFRNLGWTSRDKFPAMVSWMRMLNYEEKLLRRFSAVVVLTQPEREFLAQYAPGVKVYDHPTGVDSDFFHPGTEEPDQRVVVFVGNFRHMPNVGGIIWFLAKVWPRIRASRPDARFYVVGGNPPQSVQEAHGHDGVVVTGYVDDVRPYVQQASVFVAPIFEGVGLRGKVLEAWAMKKPVVGTRLAFEALSATDGHTCFMADEPDRFATRVCELLENKDLSEAVGAAAHELVLRSFSWDAFGELYDKIYNEIMRGQNQSGLPMSSPLVRQQV